MFRVIRMMNSAGPGATGIKKESEGDRGRNGERDRDIDRNSPRKGKLHRESNYICHYKHQNF